MDPARSVRSGTGRAGLSRAGPEFLPKLPPNVSQVMKIQSIPYIPALRARAIIVDAEGTGLTEKALQAGIPLALAHISELTRIYGEEPLKEEDVLAARLHLYNAVFPGQQDMIDKCVQAFLDYAARKASSEEDTIDELGSPGLTNTAFGRRPTPSGLPEEGIHF